MYGLEFFFFFKDSGDFNENEETDEDSGKTEEDASGR